MGKSPSQRIAPRKQFSQNFLTNRSVAQRIVDQVQIEEHDHVIEVGPGEGALTHLLLQSNAAVIHAVDLDPRVIEHLEPTQAANPGRLVLHKTDVLKTQPMQLVGSVEKSHRKVVGNIPYAITSDILFWLFDSAPELERAVIMMQKEVAMRLVAKPRTKEYGVLSVAAWYAAFPKMCFNVSPGSFFPQPQVTSTVVSFEMRPEPPTMVPRDKFRSFVRGCFSQRRKVLSNSLKVWSQQNLSVSLKEITLPSGLDLAKARAEELSPEELATLYLELHLIGGMDAAI